MIKRHQPPGRRIKARRASVSVEFALVSLFFLFPLTAGGIDMVLLLSARAKLNSALHAIYIFAWSDPQSAGDSAKLRGVIQAIDPALPTSSITLANMPLVTDICYDASGVIDSHAVFSAAGAGPAGTGGGTNTCLVNGVVDSTEVPAIIASYSLTSVVQLPVPMPFLTNPFTLTASGTIQVQ